MHSAENARTRHKIASLDNAGEAAVFEAAVRLAPYRAGVGMLLDQYHKAWFQNVTRKPVVSRAGIAFSRAHCRCAQHAQAVSKRDCVTRMRSTAEAALGSLLCVGSVTTAAQRKAAVYCACTALAITKLFELRNFGI